MFSVMSLFCHTKEQIQVIFYMLVIFYFKSILLRNFPIHNSSLVLVFVLVVVLLRWYTSNKFYNQMKRKWLKTENRFSNNYFKQYGLELTQHIRNWIIIQKVKQVAWSLMLWAELGNSLEHVPLKGALQRQCKRERNRSK